MAKQPFTDEQKNLLMDYLFNKYMEDMMRSKERSEDFYNQPPPKDMLGNERIEAKSNNPFMDMISKGISNTKPEGVMTAGNTRIIELNSLIDPDMDPGDLRTIYDDMMRESGGNYPGVDFDTFLKSIGTRTASNDEAVRQLENLFEMFKEQGMSDEEAAKAARERMENAPVRKAADGGIMYLAPGGPVTKGGSTLKPSTYTKPFEEFLMDLGFTKVDEKTGKVRGSKEAWNNFLKSKGINNPRSTLEATNLKNTMLKQTAKDKTFQ